MIYLNRGAMGYFNVTNAPANAVDGKDVATTKSISMIDWQTNLTKSLQKEDPNGKVTATSTSMAENNSEMKGMEQYNEQQKNQTSSSSQASSSIQTKSQ
jgi:hypothetical protein